MAWTASLALFAVLALAIGIVLLVWRRRSSVDGRIRLHEMMRLYGVPPPRDQASAQDAAAAERRCVACSSKQLCDELLRAGGDRSYRRFCPNALYLEWLRSTSLHFD